MKTNVAVAASAAALALAACGSGAVAVPSIDAREPGVTIKDAVARVEVIVEDRADTVVSVAAGASGLPALNVDRRGDRIVIDGGLKNDIRNCSADGVDVRGHGRVRLADAPVITIRSPRKVLVKAGGAVAGTIGAGGADVSLGSAGCGDWQVGDATGELNVSVAGSGDVVAGRSAALNANVAGSGDIKAGATRELAGNIAGSGMIEVASVDGPIAANIAGSGDIRVLAGQASSLSANVMGSGDVDFRGRAADVSANVAGSGDIRVAEASGSVKQRAVGSGRVIIGR